MLANVRRAFGELTNTPPRQVIRKTPQRGDRTTPGGGDPPTPMSNLKLLMRVASEKAEIEQHQPRRELFKEDNDENKLFIDDAGTNGSDHDYSSGNQV